MTQQRGQLVNSVRLLLGEPPDLPLDKGGIPTNLIFEIVCDVEVELLRDLDLSAKNSRIAKAELFLTTDETEYPIVQTDFHAASYVYLQNDETSDVWWPVEIVNHSSLLSMTESGLLGIAFSGVPVIAYFSWIPDSNQTLRIWYERSGNDNPTLANSTDLGSLYDSYLKLQTEAQCREILKLDVGQVLQTRLMKSERQWQRYVNRGRQQGTGYKRPVFTPPRFRPRYPFLGTRFFIP